MATKKQDRRDTDQGPFPELPVTKIEQITQGGQRGAGWAAWLPTERFRCQTHFEKHNDNDNRLQHIKLRRCESAALLRLSAVAICVISAVGRLLF